SAKTLDQILRAIARGVHQGLFTREEAVRRLQEGNYIGYVTPEMLEQRKARFLEVTPDDAVPHSRIKFTQHAPNRTKDRRISTAQGVMKALKDGGIRAARALGRDKAGRNRYEVIASNGMKIVYGLSGDRVVVTSVIFP